MIPGLGLVVVAAGTSSRMQGVDKIWIRLGEHTVLWHSLRALGSEAEHTVLVVRAGQENRARAEFASLGSSLTVVTGGPRRQDSVSLGLEQLQGASIVAVHDAARPLATADLVRQGVDLVQTCDGAIPALPVTDTIKQVDGDGVIVQTVDRSSLRSVQTPQVFRARALRHAHASAHAATKSVTDDAELMEACQFEVRAFPGLEGNLKITTSYDLWLARLLVANGRAG